MPRLYFSSLVYKHWIISLITILMCFEVENWALRTEEGYCCLLDYSE